MKGISFWRMNAIVQLAQICNSLSSLSTGNYLRFRLPNLCSYSQRQRLAKAYFYNKTLLITESILFTKQIRSTSRSRALKKL